MCAEECVLFALLFSAVRFIVDVVVVIGGAAAAVDFFVDKTVLLTHHLA